MTDLISREEALKVIETFNSLPLERKLDIFRNLSPKAREDLLGAVARPGEIVRMMSEEEVFWTIKKLGEDQAPQLIALTTGRQLLHLLDIELWKKDMFNAESAARWLEIISRAGDHKILQFVQTVDPELIITALNSLMRVSERDPDMDLLEQMDGLPGFTLDDTFFVEFLLPDLEDLLKGFLQVVYEWNTNYYFGMMRELAWNISLENQEMANKWRKARLSERGFPEFDEATEIYQYLQRDRVSHAKPEPLVQDNEDSTKPFVGYPLKVLVSDSLFKRSLEEITDTAARDRLAMELAHVANKVMIADSKDPGSVDEILESVRKVGGCINIALEDICREDVSQAVGILMANHMEILFRRGHSLILDLRRAAQKFISRQEGGIENLGYPLSGLLKGLIDKRPYYAGSLVGQAGSRPFESVDDLVGIRQMIEKESWEEGWEPI